MLQRIGEIADALAMTFGFGDGKNLDDLAVSLTSGFLLFHDGYFEAPLNFDGQGALEYRYQLPLIIAIRSSIADKPADKLANLDRCDAQMRLVIKELKKLGTLSNMRARFDVNKTSTNLDGVALTLTLLPDAVSLCTC